MTSKEVFAQLKGFMADFTDAGQDWCDNNTIVSAGRARSYSKKIINGLRAFVDASISEEIILEREAARNEVVTPEVPAEPEVPTEPEVPVDPDPQA